MGSTQRAADFGCDQGSWSAKGTCWRITLDRDLNILSSNESCLALIGKAPAELLGKRLNKVLRLAHLGSLMLKGFCFRSQPLRFEDRELLGNFEPVTEDGRPAGGVLIVCETEKIQGEAPELEDVIRSIDPITDLTNDGIILVDRHGIITMVNQAFADALGLQPNEMIGRHVHQSYPNSSLSRLPTVIDSGRAEIGEPHLLNGRQVVVSRWPLVREGRIVGAFGKILFSDVSEVTRIAGKLQAISAKGKAPATTPRRSSHRYDADQIIARCPTIVRLKQKLERIAGRGSNVLLSGESGTGKELFAHAIHAASSRREGALVRVNCAAIPEHLLESELFGYVEGAFTDARKGGQIGKFEQAHGGTIFLDEISDMSLPMQAKLLRVLQEKELTPLGASGVKQIDMRVVAATNADLEQMVAEGRFRADLYYRLNIVCLEIPPLRERGEDLLLLARHFIGYFNGEFDLQVEDLEPQAWDALRAYDFPGNIRELRNAIESAFNLVEGPRIRLEDLPKRVVRALGSTASAPADAACGGNWAAQLGRRPLQDIMEEIEKQLIEQSLERVDGNKLNAANLLGISRPGLYKKLQKYQLQ